MRILVLAFLLFSCNNLQEEKLKNYLTVHRLQKFKDYQGGRFNHTLRVSNDKTISIARFASLSNRFIMNAKPFKWEQGYGLELVIAQKAFNNWLQEKGRDNRGIMILVVDREYYSRAFYDKNNFSNPVKLYCPLPKAQAEKLCKAINKNYKLLNKE